MRGADLVVMTLRKAGVTRLFSLSGNQIMPVYDACIDAGIEIIHTRHEAAAVFMADAYAQLTGQVGIALVTAGPGFANALGPLVAVKASESPVLLLSGDAPLAQNGKGAFQELRQTTIADGLTKGSFRAVAAEKLGRDIAGALHLAASGRPGPVHLALPFDLLEADIGSIDPPAIIDQEANGFQPSVADVETISKALSAATRPLVLTGPALNRTRARTILDELSIAQDVPVISMESPRGLKDASLGNLQNALKQADVILSLGKCIDFSLGFGATNLFAEGCRWIVVDAEEDVLGRASLNLGERLIFSVHDDPRAMIKAMISHGNAATDRLAWRDEAEQHCRTDVPIDAKPGSAGKILPADLCAAVQRQIEKQPPSLVILDGGEFCQWAQAGLRADARVTNGPAGAIGGGLCYAVAAKLARPEATVFAMMGDGTVGFHLAEFETALRAGTPFVAVIGNDACWNAEHQIQMRDYGPDRLIGCELTPARYDLAVQGLGGHGEYITDLAELDSALERAIASGKPACVNVGIEGLPAPGGVPH